MREGLYALGDPLSRLRLVLDDDIVGLGGVGQRLKSAAPDVDAGLVRRRQRRASTDISNNSNASPATRNVGGRPITHLLAEINVITSRGATTEIDASVRASHTVAIRGELRDDLATTHKIC